MGAGKSSVGRALGKRLNWVFEDLDDRIEKSEGRRVAEIFRDSGEDGFRKAEHAALREALEDLRRGSFRVIALGGGAFVQKPNLTLLRESGIPTVFLDAPVEELWRRCCRQASTIEAERPLKKDLQQFRKLYGSRVKGYRKASVRIETAGRGVNTIAAEIVKKLSLRKIAIRTERGDVE